MGFTLIFNSLWVKLPMSFSAIRCPDILLIYPAVFWGSNPVADS